MDGQSNVTTAPGEGATDATPNAERQKIPLWRLIRRWWRMNVTADIDQVACIEGLREDSYLSGRYLLMIAMSAGIAILGLLLSSPAVVIGAMLLSPLMGPIMGTGMSLAIGDFQWLRRSVRALWVGTLMAVIFCALIVVLSPLQTVTPEIAARTRPNLFDLMVALFSAIAGAYAMIRGRGGAIVGVAIATALMPPLAVVGYGLATFSWTVFGGSLMLFITNLMTIALTMAVMARIYGFHSRLSDRHTLVQNVVIFAVFLGLAVPLGYSLNQIAWEANSSRIANGFLKDMFGESARVTGIEFDFDARPIVINATVLTPKFIAEAEGRAVRSLSRQIGVPVAVSIEQYRVGTGAADSAAVAAARAREQALSTEREVARLAERLSLIAGVPAEFVTIDPQRKRALVKAEPLSGASIAAYRQLEARVAALDPDWNLLVVPPALSLPEVELSDEKPSERGSRNLELIIWAAQRVDAPLGINGPTDAVDNVIAGLSERGVRAVRSLDMPNRAGRLTVNWLAPDALAEQ